MFPLQNLEVSNIRLSCPKTGTEVQGSVTEREDTMGVVRMDFQQEVHKTPYSLHPAPCSLTT